MLIKRIAMVVLQLGIIALPVMIAVLLLRVHLQVDPARYVPVEPNDSTVYWLQIQSFTAAGFNGGYFTWAEQPAAAVFTHFYTWGPAFPALYGSIGQVIGWQYWTLPLLNTLVITAALAIFLTASQWMPRQLLLLAVLLVIFYPIHFFLTSGRQESLHHAFALLLALPCVRTVDQGANMPRREVIAIIALILFAGLFRITWSLILLPLLLITAERRRRSLILALVQALVLIGLSAAVYRVTSAPFPNFLSRFLAALGDAPGEALILFIDHAINNLESIGQYAPMWNLPTYLALILTGGAAMFLMWHWRHPPAEALFHLFNLGAILLTAIFVYEIREHLGFRILSSHVLLSLLVLLVYQRWRILLGVTAFSLLFMPSFFTVYGSVRIQDYRVDTVEIERFREQTAHLLDDSAAASGWCRTVLLKLGDEPDARSEFSIPREVLGLPPTFGFSFLMRPNDLDDHPKSRYLLLSDETYARLDSRLTRRHDRGLNTRALMTTSAGVLYENLETACE